MAGYDSPLGKKQFQGQPFKEVVIPDESGASQPPPVRPQLNYQVPQFDEAAIREFNARLNPQMQSPPMSQDQAEAERQFREARTAKFSGKERLNEGAKRRIEMLVGMTRGTRTVDIEGNVYILKTLRDNELSEAVLAASQFDGTIKSPFEIRKQLLCRSLTQIAGMDADQFFGTTDIEVKREGIEYFDHYLLGRLYDEYLEMVKNAKDRYAIKNAQDAQEVVEDLKK